MQDEDIRKSIKTAQDRKDYSIAFYNSTNNAIELVKKLDVKEIDAIKTEITYWRDWFLLEHLQYRKQVTEEIGVIHTQKNAIDLLNKAKDKESLDNVWVSLSADERSDPVLMQLFESQISKL
jgi:chorismate mutase